MHACCIPVLLWAKSMALLLCWRCPLPSVPGGVFAVQVSIQSLVGVAQSLAAQVIAQPISLDMPASHVAAVLVTAGRKAAGLHPVWPKSLMVMTGLLNPQGSAPAQQLLADLAAPASSS